MLSSKNIYTELFPVDKLRILTKDRLKRFKRSCHAFTGDKFIDTCGCGNGVHCWWNTIEDAPNEFSEIEHQQYLIFKENMIRIKSVIKER